MLKNITITQSLADFMSVPPTSTEEASAPGSLSLTELVDMVAAQEAAGPSKLLILDEAWKLFSKPPALVSLKPNQVSQHGVKYAMVTGDDKLLAALMDFDVEEWRGLLPLAAADVPVSVTLVDQSEQGIVLAITGPLSWSCEMLESHLDTRLPGLSHIVEFSCN